MNAVHARTTGGRYTPPADITADIVTITCGDADLGEILNCAALAATTLDGKPIKPLSYASGPVQYKNAVGASWSVARVVATYDMRDMKDGFWVAAKTPDGIEWPLKVSSQDAEAELLLRVGEPKPMPTTQLSVVVRAYGNGWSLSNQTRGYTWTDCVARVGTSKANISELEPFGTVILNRSDFTPEVVPGTGTLEVSCTINGKIFEATITTTAP